MDIKDGVLVKVYDEDIKNGTIKIPKEVTSIGNSAFFKCEGLTKIKIPKTVTSIGHDAFKSCSNLTKIKIPKTITSIEPNAFKSCSNLTNINIPKSVTSIGRYAFEGCTSLTKINIPESVTDIGGYAFSECRGLTKINIPQNMTVISPRTFIGCSNLTEINIPESITDIEFGAFIGCENLTEINIPQNVTTIGYGAFYGCKKLTKINIPKGLEHIENYTFEGCSSITEINIPENVTYIGIDAFRECNNLVKISLPKSLIEIENGAFRGCKSLTKINIPKGLKRIKNSIFDGCSSIKEINIPEDVTVIGADAFQGCNNLVKISLPKSLIEIENGAFGGCKSLTEINIPRGLKHIKNNTFNGCSSIKEINIPQSVTDIGGYAFADCSGLTEINIPEGVAKIGNGTFEHCTGLTEINIPASVEIFESKVFNGCNNLKSIKLSEEIIKNENTLYRLYEEHKDKIDSRLMFGNDLARFNGIKSQACFSVSEDYDENFINQLYHKIIYSAGIDELEVMVKIPQLNAEQLVKYDESIKAREKAFKQLYDKKEKLSENFGTVVKILKQLAISVNTDKTEGAEKSLSELDILKQINVLLSNSEAKFNSLEDLVHKAMEGAGYNFDRLEKSIKDLQSMLNKSQFQKNINEVKQTLLQALSDDDATFGQQLATLQVEPIEKIIEDKIRKIYMNNSKVTIQNLSSELLSELSSINHSVYIRNNAQNITDRFMNLIETNEDFKRKINYNSIDAIKSVKNQIGGRWIESIKQAFKFACNRQNIESIPDEFSLEQVEILKNKLGINIKTEQVAVLKKGASREEAYKLLESIQSQHPEENQLIVTYKQLHDMFGGVCYPYSEEFKKFFKLHRDDFLRNPKYIPDFATICNNFDVIINSPELKNIYLNGNLEIDDILGYMGSLTFENQREGDEKLAQLATSVGQIVTDKQFEEVQKVFDIVKMRERASIPPMYVQDNKSKFRGRMLSPNDIMTMFAGNITDCCQRFGDCGMGAMLLGAVEENAGIFVIEELQEDGSYQIVGQSLTIRQKGKDGNNDRLTFDNIEITKNVKSRLTKDDEKAILKIYQDAGNQAIDLDKKFLGQLLMDGKISKEDYDNLVLKEVIAGRGYNDLNILDTLPDAKTIVPDEAYYTYMTKEWGISEPWIDSTKYGAPNGSNWYDPVVIATMSSEEEKAINSRRKLSKKKISDLTNVSLWYGKVDEPQELYNQLIKEKELQMIKSIERKVYREPQQLINNNNINNYEDLMRTYGLEDITSIIGSEKNWYMIYGTGENGECKIQDLALEGGLNSKKNKKMQDNQKPSRLAIVEMADAVYKLMIQNAKDGVKTICNATKDTSLINIKNMIRKGIAEVYDFDGNKIVISNDGQLVYENGEKIIYRNFKQQNDGEEPIQMLDIEIRANVERMIEEKIKTEKYLQLARKAKRMKGVEKEVVIDEARRKIREDLEK